MTPAQIAAHDRASAALHEAAHVTVSLARGARVRALITRNETTDSINEKLWVGKCEITGRNFDAAEAVAGMVAEYVAGSHDADPQEIIDHWQTEENCISPSDLARCPDDWRGRELAVEEALSTLRREKRLFDAIVAELMTAGVITDARGAELADDLLAQKQKRRNTRNRKQRPRQKQ
jgi:hypothetical protein